MRARKAAGLSMQALADQVGVSATMINKYEKGKSTPGSKALIQLSKALGVRSEYFFRPVQVQLEGVEYRKRASTPKSC
ncbi:helix-turn-helix transcriptional regulator [Halomonas sp. LY9]